jgi:hypothetical protein
VAHRTRHLLLLASALAGAYAATGRRWQLHWGASASEVAAPLPGDEQVLAAHLVATRAITVRAPAERVWPWIAQLGQGRGGFYSYDRLENLVGCDIHSADHVEPAWQHPQVGDPFHLHPEVALEVVEVDRGHALVVRGAVPAGGTEGAPPYDFSWAFVVRPQVGTTTARLLVRERYRYTQRWAPALVEPVAVVSFVMTRKMLHGIRERAERLR